MATKLYFHAAANALSGTYPTGEQGAGTPSYSGTGATTLRKMDTTIGTSQTSMAGSSLGSTAFQFGFYGFWCSPKLSGDQTIGGSGLGYRLNIANAQSNLNMDFGEECDATAYIWNPSTGAVQGTLFDWSSTNGGNGHGALEPTSASSEQVNHVVGPETSAVNASDGYVIIVEIWMRHQQPMGSSYTGTIYYDGTTENTTPQAVVSNHASFIEFDQNIVFQGSSSSMVGSAAGTGAASGTGRVTFAGVGTAAGTSTASGTGRETAAGTASATGTGAASGTGRETAAATASAAGTSTADGVGRETAAATASGAGTSTAAGVGLETAAATATGAGTAGGTATGTAINALAGTAAGTSTAAASGSAVSSSPATAAGTSTASAVGALVLPAVASAAGTSTASGVGAETAAATATAAGTSTVAATGAETAATVGSSAGVATASGTLAATHTLTGNNAQTTPTSSTGAISQTHLLTGNNVQATAACTAAAVGQSHILSGSAARTIPTSSVGSISQSHVLGGNAVRTTPVSSNGAVGQTHQLLGDAANQPNISGTGSVSSSGDLTGNSTRTLHISSVGSIQQTQTVAGNAANQPNISSTGSIQQTHTLTGNSVNQPNTSSTGAIGQQVDLTGNSVLGYHTSTNGEISQTSNPGVFVLKALLAIVQLKTGAHFLTTQTHDITMAKGKTFSLQLSYAEDELVYKPITAIPTLAPARLTVTAHGLPSRWPVRTESAIAPTELAMVAPNWRLGTRFDANTVELNDLNLLSAKPFVGPAVLVYQKPADMTGWKLRMQIRDLTSNALLLSASSDVSDGAVGTIDVDVPNSAFVVNFTAATTAAVAWTKAGYDIEAILPDGSVVSLIGPSKITAEKEYTVWP
jgi:hypothetical protein